MTELRAVRAVVLIGALAIPDHSAFILTPRPPATPRINGAKVFGVRPGHPFLFTIPATGQRPMTFGAARLPAGLSLDAVTGRTGTAICDRSTCTTADSPVSSFPGRV